MDLTEKERSEIITLYYGGNSIRQVRDFWAGTRPNRPIPSVGFISNLVKRFQNTGRLLPSERGGRRRNENAENIEVVVLATSQQNPEMSSSSVSKSVGASKANVIRILHKHGYKSYKFQIHQELLPQDLETRNIFCETMLERANNDNNFIKRICFSDESSFTLNGEPNVQNTRVWSQNNPRGYLALRSQWPRKVNVWLGVLAHHVIGPFYIDGNLDGQKYLRLLEQHVLPEIQRVSGAGINNIWFQHDGCPSHYTREVTQFLDTHFTNRWIGRGGAINWPPRSPDLAPNDFHLWPHIVNKIYGSTKYNNLEELKQAINYTCTGFSRQQLANVRKEFYNRLSHCLIQNGGHFEHLLK